MVGLEGQRTVILAREQVSQNTMVGYSFDVVTGQQLATLRATDLGQGDRLGFASSGAYSIDIDGGTAVICGEYDGSGGSKVEAVYAFDVASGNQLARLVAGDNQGSGPAGLGDFFGAGVAIDGNLVLVGSPFDDDMGFDSGSVYLFDLNTGSQLRKYVANDGAIADQFGSRVALQGTTAVIAAPFDDDNGTSAGSVYVLDLTTGQQTFKLLASDGTTNQLFGADLDVDGGLAIIGAPYDDAAGVNAGAAYVFDLDTGQELYKFVSSQPIAGGLFGNRVSISGNYAAVGATGELVAGEESGAAYVFDLLTGAEVTRVEPSIGNLWSNFDRVAIDGGLLTVGAPGMELLGGIASEGTVHVYDIDPIANSGFAYCFGDGTGSACPCGVLGAANTGCGNATGAGARLTAQGQASLSSDNLGFQATGLPTPAIGLVFRAPMSAFTPAGFPVANGLLCLGNLGVDRGQVMVSSTGTLQISNHHGAGFGTGRSPGDVDHFQLWYRDAQSSCSSQGFNFSNAWWATWKP